jgi:hypothetical protein
MIGEIEELATAAELATMGGRAREGGSPRGPRLSSLGGGCLAMILVLGALAGQWLAMYAYTGTPLPV